MEEVVEDNEQQPEVVNQFLVEGSEPRDYLRTVLQANGPYEANKEELNVGLKVPTHHCAFISCRPAH